MKYKIGEVSKILNIPVDTLRYLEAMKIVSPDKEDGNHYRHYEAWDINFLTEYRKYRGFDFSVADIEKILHHDDLAAFTQRIRDRQGYFENRFKHYALLKEKNLELTRTLDSLKDDLWKCSFSTRNELYYFMHRYNYKYATKDEFGGVFERWIEYFPFVESLVEIKEDAALSRETCNDYGWGFSLRKEYLEAFRIPLNATVKHLPQAECVRTIIRAGEKGSFSLRLLDKAFDFLAEHAYRLAGDITGNLLARVHSPEGYSRYIEMWIPIQKNIG